MSNNILNAIQLIAHAIKRYIRVGYELTDGTNIETALQNLSGTSVAQIEPNRNKTIEELALSESQFAGYIRACFLPHIGVWTDFQPAQVVPFSRRPSPTFSKPSIPETIWKMPTPRKTELPTNESVSTEMSDVITIKDKSIDQEFPFNAGWALKENMKLGNKGAGKHMTKKVLQYLQGFFLAGNLKTEDRYSPEDMHASLKDLAKNEELAFEEVPTVKTIKGWIGRYSASFKKEVSERALTESNNSDIHTSTYNEKSDRISKRQKMQLEYN
ncbi:8309_t:CDS:2 [Scutellospora calospora]|uniref:8309_t:CDS:1 n=1 Tax=Scutellospora calospora TaxID=85575 RepID=A0ACA9KER7_9GLOM|nr:8309_t:CDS:2 [Scutellospora calospora]